MKRALVVALVVGLMAGLLTFPADAGNEKNKKKKKSARIAASAGPRRVTCPSSARRVRPSDNLQAKINSAGRGASLCFKRGIYRIRNPLQPRTGQTLTFERGATLNGSRLVTNWTKEGSYWVSGGHAQNFSDAPWLEGHKCDDNPAACVYEDLFMDGRPLTHVRKKSQLGRGKVYFDKGADKMYIADDPRGHTLEATATTFGIDVKVDDVTLRGATIEKFAWGGLQVSGAGWTVDRNEFRYAHGRGLALGGDRHVVTRNHIHHNGNTGLVAGSGHKLVFTGNHIHHNNYLGFGKKPTAHHEGGVKMLRMTDTVVRGNYSHHNDGDGWWFDFDNKDIVVEGNFFEHNTRYGLFYEASFDATIRDNVFRKNGTDKNWRGSGIRISSARNVTVVANRFVRNNYSTLFVNTADRGKGPYGRRSVTNLHVHHNKFIMTTGWIGAAQGDDEVSDPKANNRFENNLYVVSDLNHSWWTWRPAGFMGWGKWRSTGFDTSGTLTKVGGKKPPKGDLPPEAKPPKPVPSTQRLFLRDMDGCNTNENLLRVQDGPDATCRHIDQKAIQRWSSIEGTTFKLDASRPITGEITTAGGRCVVDDGCLPTDVGTGEAELDIRVLGAIDGEERELGAWAEAFTVAPGDRYTRQVRIELSPLVANAKVRNLRVVTQLQGAIGHSVVVLDNPASFIKVPTFVFQ